MLGDHETKNIPDSKLQPKDKFYTDRVINIKGSWWSILLITAKCMSLPHAANRNRIPVVQPCIRAFHTKYFRFQHKMKLYCFGAGINIRVVGACGPDSAMQTAPELFCLRLCMRAAVPMNLLLFHFMGDISCHICPMFIYRTTCISSYTCIPYISTHLATIFYISATLFLYLYLYK